MKTEIVLTKNNQSARITLTYDNPFTSTSFKIEGDTNLLSIFEFYSVEKHGYFIGFARPTNAEWYLNILPVLRLKHEIYAQIDKLPPFEKYMDPADKEDAIY